MSPEWSLALLGCLVLAVGIGLRMWWQHRVQDRVLGSLVAVLDSGALQPAHPALLGSMWVVGSLRGRAARLGIVDHGEEGGPLWKATFDLSSTSLSFFDLGRQDGPESYVAQLPDPALRAAVRRLVETHQAASIALNASSPQLPAPYRLRVTIEQATRRPSVAPAAARDILDQASKIAELTEG